MSDFDWSETDINVLYDVFYEQGTILAAEYISLSYQAEDAGDRDGAAFWSEQVRQVDRERSNVDPDDRNAMIEAMRRWQRTREQIQRLRALTPAAAWRAFSRTRIGTGPGDRPESRRSSRPSRPPPRFSCRSGRSRVRGRPVP